MKNPLPKVMLLLFFLVLGLTPVLTILATHVPKWIFKDDLVAQESLTNILINVVVAIMFIITIIFAIKGWRAQNKYWHLQEEKAKEQLTSEFQKVQLKTIDVISKDMFECQAKIDDDGKIVCKIHANYVNYETKLNNYEEFTQFFSLDNKQQ